MTTRIGLGDAEDPRVVEAAERIAAGGIAVPVLFGATGRPPAGTVAAPAVAGMTSLEQLAEAVRHGDVTVGIVGSLSTSALVVRTGMRRLGSDRLVSACFALGHAGRWTTYADCVVVPEPTSDQLAQIAISAAEHHRRVLGEEPRIAMLSFSTGGSASHPRVDVVRAATARVRAERPDLAVDGEIQFDVAVDPEVARRKAPTSPVAGAANVLVFPSLEAANIAYKVAERVGGERALGSFVLGLSHPWVDLSRGCSVEDIVETAELLGRAVRPAPQTSVA